MNRSGFSIFLEQGRLLAPGVLPSQGEESGSPGGTAPDTIRVGTVTGTVTRSMCQALLESWVSLGWA